MAGSLVSRDDESCTIAAGSAGRVDKLGDPRFRLVLQRALFQRLIGSEYVVQLAARAGLIATDTQEATS
jgi:hypothetical protein